MFQNADITFERFTKNITCLNRSFRKKPSVTKCETVIPFKATKRVPSLTALLEIANLFLSNSKLYEASVLVL